jgi:CBS domain
VGPTPGSGRGRDRVKHQINAVPVVDDGGRLVGIVSETTRSSRMGDDGTSSAGDDPPDAGRTVG